jgi:hypothetical protein
MTLEETMLQLIDAGYRTLAKTMHPDAGGTSEAMRHLTQARDQLKALAPRADKAMPREEPSEEQKQEWARRRAERKAATRAAAKRTADLYREDAERLRRGS